MQLFLNESIEMKDRSLIQRVQTQIHHDLSITLAIKLPGKSQKSNIHTIFHLPSNLSCATCIFTC